MKTKPLLSLNSASFIVSQLCISKPLIMMSKAPKAVLFSPLGSLPGRSMLSGLWAYALVSLEAGHVLMISLSPLYCYLNISLLLVCLGAHSCALERLACTPIRNRRVVETQSALGSTVALQPGGHHDLLVIYCHNINHAELTWH